MLGMGKENVVRWIKNEVNVEKCNNCLEPEELYWFTQRTPRTETRENVYVMIVSRAPRQIVSFDVAQNQSAWRIQRIVDSAPEAQRYCRDGYVGCLDVVYSRLHVRNMCNKSDTHTVEGVNADLRHYIPLFKRRNRYFARSPGKLQAVVACLRAYNRFGQAKFHHRLHYSTGNLPFLLADFL